MKVVFHYIFCTYSFSSGLFNSSRGIIVFISFDYFSFLFKLHHVLVYVYVDKDLMVFVNL